MWHLGVYTPKSMTTTLRERKEDDKFCGTTFDETYMHPIIPAFFFERVTRDTRV